MTTQIISQDLGLDKVRAIQFEVRLSLTAADDATSMSWNFFLHKDEIMPVLFMLGNSHDINHVIHIVWACHGVEGSSVLTRNLVAEKTNSKKEFRTVFYTLPYSEVVWYQLLS